MAANVLLTHAMKYMEMGLSVIPIKHGDKRPLIKWEPFQEVRATKTQLIGWWSMHPDANIGIVTGPISNLAVVDIDTEEGKEAITEYIPADLQIPKTKTPKGGNHLFFTYPENFDIGNNARIIPGCDFRGKGGYVVAPPSVNGNGNRYEWIREFSRDTLVPLPEAYIKKVQGRQEKRFDKIEHEYRLFERGTRDNDLFHIANCMKKGGARRFEMEQVLERLIASWGESPDPKWISAKVESAVKRSVTRERNLAEEVREWILTTEGYFFTTDLQQELQITTPDEKKNLTVILVRLQKEGVIDKQGDRRGCYRRVVNDEHEMNFIEQPLSEFPVKLPFGLNKLCRLYAKNIVVIAGTKSSGKTATLLDIAIANQHNIPVVYLNSEMGDEEYTERLKAFGCTKKDDIKFKCLSCNTNFQDKITDERKIFIVDFLEVHDNFFEIAKPIRAIHEKLKDGICIIGIQKKSNGPKEGNLLGRGGDFSMEKARLYLSMDYMEQMRATKVTIVDAKSPKVPDGVRGLFRHYKIIGGHDFRHMDEEWRR